MEHAEQDQTQTGLEGLVAEQEAALAELRLRCSLLEHQAVHFRAEANRVELERRELEDRLHAAGLLSGPSPDPTARLRRLVGRIPGAHQLMWRLRALRRRS